jgi:hypothetical protein
MEMFRRVSDQVGSNRQGAPSPAMAVSMIALFVALGGSAYAACSLPSNSVGTKQLKNGAVTRKKLANNAVTSGQVKDGSLLAKDLQRGQLQAGPPGPKGDPGVSGATNIVMRTGPDFWIPRHGWAGGSAHCHTGEKATGGGAYPATFIQYPPTGTQYPTILASYPEPNPVFGTANDGVTPTGWTVWVSAPLSTQTVFPNLTMTPYVVCASP